jgi:hypothetical protein
MIEDDDQKNRSKNQTKWKGTYRCHLVVASLKSWGRNYLLSSSLGTTRIKENTMMGTTDYHEPVESVNGSIAMLLSTAVTIIRKVVNVVIVVQIS